MSLFPHINLLAPVTSFVLLVMLGAGGELGRGHVAVLGVSFAVTAYLQFFGSTLALAAAGLTVQTLLAIYLVFRWKLAWDEGVRAGW